MKLVIGYTATIQYRAVLERTLRYQRQFPAFERFVVTDRPADFEHMLLPVHVDPWRSGHFCISACRNASIQYADRMGADWLVMVDADAVIPNVPTIFPKSGFARLNMYRTVEGQDPMDLWLSPHKEQIRQGGWYLVGRQLFGRRFDEQYVGYGLEEADWLHVVLQDIEPGETDLAAIHLWHERREWSTQPQLKRHKLMLRDRMAPVLAARREREAIERKRYDDRTTTSTGD